MHTPFTPSLMQGFPPEAPDQIRFDDLARLQYPGHRWVYSHWRELVPTATVWRGDGPITGLPSAPQDLERFEFADPAGGRCTLDRALEISATDGLLVMHDGKVLYERYFGHLSAHLPHRCFSVTKSFVGLLAGMLIHEGLLARDTRVVSLIPELRDSGWSDAIVQQVLDMTLNLTFDEDYANGEGDVVRSRLAAGTLPRPAAYSGPRSIYEYLPTIAAAGPHHGGFEYITPNTQVLSWLVQRASGKSLPTLLSERIWQRIGAQQDGYFAVDPTGIADAGGGLCVTLRDLARFGELIRNHGRIGNDQIIPAQVLEQIARGSDRDAFRHAGYAMFEGWSYHDQWWISHDVHGAIRGLGVYGQQLYVAPRAGLVIARFGSQPIAVDERVEKLLLSAWDALAHQLTREGP